MGMNQVEFLNYLRLFHLDTVQRSSSSLFGNPNVGRVYFVDGNIGSDNNDGRDPELPLATIDAAWGKVRASKGDVIVVSPATYTEAVVADVAGVTMLGLSIGQNRTILLGPIAGAVEALTVSAANISINGFTLGQGHADQDATLLTTSAAVGLLIEDCVFDDSGAVTSDIGISLVASCDFVTIKNCEFNLNTIGIQCVTTDDVRIIDCLFVGNVTSDIGDAGTGNNTLLLIKNCTFATAPTDYLVLSGGTTTGMVTGCTFAASAAASAEIAIDTGMFFVDNKTEESMAGAPTGQAEGRPD